MNKFFNNDNNDNKKSTKNSMDSMESIVIDKIKTNNIKIKIIDTEALNYDTDVNPISKPPSPSSPGWDII